MLLGQCGMTFPSGLEELKGKGLEFYMLRLVAQA